MYRINLYPEYADSRKAARGRAASSAVLFGLLGLEVLLVGAIILSDSLLREQVGALRTELPRLEAELVQATRERPELDQAVDMLDLRSQRVDWSPKLAAIAENLDPSLMLVELDARGITETERTRLNISGQYRNKKANLTTVSAYIEKLRQDPRFLDGFATVDLGNIRSDGAGEFDLVCKPAGEGD